MRELIEYGMSMTVDQAARQAFEAMGYEIPDECAVNLKRGSETRSLDLDKTLQEQDVSEGDVFVLCARLTVSKDIYSGLASSLKFTEADFKDRKVIQGSDDNAFIADWQKNGGTSEKVMLEVHQTGMPDSDLSVREVKRDLYIMSRLGHPAVLSLIGFIPQVDGSGRQIIVRPYMPNGSLRDMISSPNENPLWSVTQKYVIMYGIAEGMAYLHDEGKGMIRWNLRLDNVFLDSDMSPRIGQFWSSRENQSVEHSIIHGPMIYTAPEVIVGGYLCTNKVDVYSYGVMLFTVFTGHDPFSVKTTAFSHFKSVAEGKRPTIPDAVPQVIAGLISQCWHCDPDLRPSFREIAADLASVKIRTEVGVVEEEFSRYQAKLHTQITSD